MRSFETWLYEEVEDAFGLELVEEMAAFDEWLAADGIVLTDEETRGCEKLRKMLFREVINWNEDELKLLFIGPLLNLADLYSTHFKIFTQRTLTIQTETVSASGKVDFMLARGKAIPKQPFFCLHEYKQENRRDNDPRGQLLISMIAAQNKNKNELPIFGIYVSGRNWFFVLLNDKKYVVSDAYVATSEDIFKIIAILKKCKELVEQHSIQS
jgi:hypothetical protein